jgi:hypothetical protein
VRAFRCIRDAVENTTTLNHLLDAFCDIEIDRNDDVPPSARHSCCPTVRRAHGARGRDIGGPDDGQGRTGAHPSIPSAVLTALRRDPKPQFNGERGSQ